MGRETIDKFARLYVVPNGGHGLSGRSYKVNGDGKPVEVKNIPGPSGSDNMDLIMNWVEKNQAPAKTLVVDPKGKISEKQEGLGYLLCSYPNYAKYVSGATDQVSSYISETH